MAIHSDEIRRTIRQAIGGSVPDYPDEDVDRAFIRAATELQNATKCVRTSGSLTLTLNIASVSLTGLTGFLPENFRYAELGYSDQGTWSSGTAYTLRQLVQGDGSPDALLYKCILAHTSSSSDEPPNTTYWSNVLSKIGDVHMRDISYEDIRRKLKNSAATDEPTHIAFRDDTTAYVYPAPDVAYTVDVHYYPVFETFTPGDEANFTFDIPDAYILPVLWEGAAASLNAPHPDALAASPQWRQFVTFSIPRIKAQRSSGGRTGWKDRAQFSYG